MGKLLDKYRSLPVQVKATVWFFVCSILQRGISTITTPIFTRLLTTEQYGQWSVFSSWQGIISIIVSLQLAGGVYTMGVVKFKDEENVFTSSLQGLTFTLCLVWTIIYVFSRDFWNQLFNLTTVQMLAMLVMIWASSSYHFWMTWQRNRYNYKALVGVTLAVSIANPVVGILCVINAQDKVTARILAVALVEIVAYSGFFFVQMARGKKFFSAKYWKYAVLFNLPLIPHYLSGSILGSSDRIMIERMVGMSQAGIYSLAYSISQIMALVNDSLNKSMSPFIYQKIGQEKYEDISKAFYPCLVLIAMANLALIAIAPEIVHIFAPVQYHEAIYVIPPVAMSVYVGYLYLGFAPFEFFHGKRIWTTVGTFTSALSNIVLNLICIRLFGYMAAGYTTLASTLVNACMHYYFMRKVCRTKLNNIKPYDPKILVGITVVFMAIGFAYIPTYSNTLLRYGLTLVLLGVAFIMRKRLVSIVREMLSRRKTKVSTGMTM